MGNAPVYENAVKRCDVHNNENDHFWWGGTTNLFLSKRPIPMLKMTEIPITYDGIYYDATYLTFGFPFFTIKGNSYITPKSPSILPSITNMSLETVAAHLGMEVERRPVHVDELSTFEEVGECGTAVVITPVHKLVDKPFLESEEETVYTYGDGQCGPKSLKLYNFIVSIQKGEIEDPFGWITYVE